MVSSPVAPLAVDLRGHRALVTGASGRLGRQIAVTLATCGADVVVHFHHSEAQALLVASEITELGRNATVAQADITSASSVEQMAEVVHAAGPPVDVLVLNAVEQIHPWKTLLETAPADFESQFRSCVLHAVHCAKAFVPAMKERGQGRVIGVNTECAMQMFETQAAYVAGKRGMDGALRVLAREVGPFGVTVNQVAPGWVQTPDSPPTAPGVADYESRVPLRRRGTEAEVAAVVAFLASDLASYVHGAFIPVCGGNVMPCI